MGYQTGRTHCFHRHLALVAAVMLLLLSRPSGVFAQEMDFEMEDDPDAEPVEIPLEEDPPLEEEPPLEEDPPVGEDPLLTEATDLPAEMIPAYGFAVATTDGIDEARTETQRVLRDLIVGDEHYSLDLADARLHGLEQPAGDALAQAEELYWAGRDSYDNMEYGQALEQFRQAIAVFEEQVAHMPDLMRLTDCLLFMGASQVFEGQSRPARGTFRRLLIVDPERRPDEDMFPPPVIEAFDYPANRMRRVHDTTITIQTNVADADIYLDGILLGPGPHTQDVKEGRHYVRARMAGYFEAGQVVEVGRRGSEVDFVLEPTADGPVVEDLLGQLPGQLAERPDDAVGTIQRLGEILGLEIMLTVVLTGTDDGVDATMYAWDVLQGERIAQRTAGPITGEGLDVATELVTPIEELINLAWTAQNAPPEEELPPDIVPDPEPDPIVEPSPPFYRRWWFWTVVGVVVVGAAVGIGVGVGVSNQGPERRDGQLILDL